MERYALALDLQEDESLIAEYERLHKDVQLEIKQSISNAGIYRMEIYRFANRVFMIIETVDGFAFERKASMDAENPAVQEWEALVGGYQKPIPGAQQWEKWVVMNKIFEFSDIDGTNGK